NQIGRERDSHCCDAREPTHAVHARGEGECDRERPHRNREQQPGVELSARPDDTSSWAHTHRDLCAPSGRCPASSRPNLYEVRTRLLEIPTSLNREAHDLLRRVVGRRLDLPSHPARARWRHRKNVEKAFTKRTDDVCALCPFGEIADKRD